MEIEGAIHQISAKGRGFLKSYVNINDAIFGAIEVWGNSYELPTVLLRSLINDQWNLIVFSDETCYQNWKENKDREEYWDWGDWEVQRLDKNEEAKIGAKNL